MVAEPAAEPKQEAAGEAKQVAAPSSQPAVHKDEEKTGAAPAAAALKAADKAAPAAAVAALEPAPSSRYQPSYLKLCQSRFQSRCVISGGAGVQEQSMPLIKMNVPMCPHKLHE